MQRHVLEEFPPAQAKHVITQAIHAYPHAAVHRLEPAGDQIIVCCDDVHSSKGSTADWAVNGFVSFSSFIKSVNSAPLGAPLPNLPAAVHPLTPADATIKQPNQVAILTPTVWAQRLHRGVQVRSVEGAVATFTANPIAELVIHGTHRAHIVVRAAEKTVTQATIQTDADTPAEDGSGKATDHEV